MADSINWGNLLKGIAPPVALLVGGGVAGFYVGRPKHRVLGTAAGLGGGGALVFAWSRWQAARNAEAARAFEACLAAKGVTPDSTAAIARMPAGADKEVALMARVAVFDACAQA